MPNIALVSNVDLFSCKANNIAKNLNIPFIKDNDTEPFDFLIQLTSEGIEILSLKIKNAKPFSIDFLTPKMLHRMKKVSLKSELLARALGSKPKDTPYIIDATAGLCRDSFILASLGFHIELYEYNPFIVLLLKDALERGKKNLTIKTILDRFILKEGDARILLPKLKTKPDIIYLDPMFPEREKKAAVKKEMVFLQHLNPSSNNYDQTDLVISALSNAKKRVIIKRPRLAKPLWDKPSFTLAGKTIRYDVYVL